MYYARPEHLIGTSLRDSRRRQLLFVDDRPTRLTRSLLAREDVEPILLRFTTDPALPLAHLRQTAGCRVFTFDPGLDFESEIARLQRFLTDADIRLDGFLNHSEPAQIVSHAIAQKLGLNALSEEAVLWVRDKARMKERFRELGFQTAEFMRVAGPAGVLTFARHHGFPVVLKPLDGFACIDTHLLAGEADLDAIDMSNRRDWLVESFVALKEWEICALVQNGEVLAWFPSYMPAPPLQTTNGAINANISVGPSEIGALKPLQSIVERLVSGLRLRDGYLHMELFFESPERPILGEIAFRLAGCEIPANHGLAYGFDIYNAVIDIALGGRPAIPNIALQAAGDLLLPAKGGRVRFITPRQQLLAVPGVVEAMVRFRAGDEVQVRRASHFSAGYVHIVGDDVAEVERRMHEVLNMFEMTTTAASPSIAFFATAFGFGPVSKAATIAQRLRLLQPETRLTYFGAGDDLDFALGSEAFNEVVTIDVDRPADADRLVERVAAFDAAVSIMNEALPPRWPIGHDGLVMVDSLAWLWPAPPPGVERAAAYFVQDYMVPAARLDAWRHHHPIELVGPIVSAPEDFGRVVDEDYVLLNFNGSASFVQPQAWFEHVIRVTVSCVVQSPALAGRSIVVATNAKVAAALAAALGRQVLIANFPVHQMPALMRQADVILSTPGITSTLEAFQLGLPIGLLLPLNYSQMLMSLSYHDRFGDRSGLAPANFGDKYTTAAGLPEGEGVARTMACIDALLHAGRGDICSRIDGMLAGDFLLEPSDLTTFRLQPELTNGAGAIAGRVIKLASARMASRTGAS